MYAVVPISLTYSVLVVVVRLKFVTVLCKFNVIAQIDNIYMQYSSIATNLKISFLQTYGDPVLHQQPRAATTQQSIPLPNVKHSAQNKAVVSKFRPGRIRFFN